MNHTVLHTHMLYDFIYTAHIYTCWIAYLHQRPLKRSDLCLKLQESQPFSDLLRQVQGLLLGLCLSLVKILNSCNQLSWKIKERPKEKKRETFNKYIGFFFLVNIGLRLCLLPSELLRCILTAEGINCCHFLFMTWYRTINCSCSRERSKAVELHEYIPNRKRQARPRSEGETPPGRNLKLVSTSILIRERNKKSASQSQRNTLKKYSELPSKEALIGFTFLIP